MLPLNTVQITAEELKQLPKYCLVWGYMKPVWACNLSDAWVLDGCSEYRIAAHDYRHYFGEVVDLAKYSTKVEDNRVVIIYLGVSADYIQVDAKRYELTFNGSGRMILNILVDEELCKQKLIDHFTAIAAKDLPNVNLKFIFS